MENKKISTLIGIIVIVVVAFVAFAGILVLEKTKIPTVVEIKKTAFQKNNTDKKVVINNVEVEGCTDSDGGKNYYVKGKTTGVSIWNDKGPFEDYCINDSRAWNLQEYSCVGTQVIGSGFTCPYGCLDGACVSLKEYSDKDFNFTIEYPANWYINVSDAAGGTRTIMFSNSKDETNPKDLYVFGMSVLSVDPQTDYNYILSRYKPIYYTEEETVIVDGIKATKLTKTTDEHLIKSLNTFKATNIYTFVLNNSLYATNPNSDTLNNNLYTFNYSLNNPYTGEIVSGDKIEIAKKIISTFKLTK